MSENTLHVLLLTPTFRNVNLYPTDQPELSRPPGRLASYCRSAWLAPIAGLQIIDRRFPSISAALAGQWGDFVRPTIVSFRERRRQARSPSSSSLSTHELDTNERSHLGATLRRLVRDLDDRSRACSARRFRAIITSFGPLASEFFIGFNSRAGASRTGPGLEQPARSGSSGSRLL